MEGSTATISAIAAGDAVITITASDGSASVSQSFRIDVPQGPEEATVVISRLLDAERNQISDPSGISGTIYAVLDVQSNDETWTEIGLTLNGETVTPLCRGTGSTSADVSVGPGLAAAGQVEIECALVTNDVVGECVGMQLDPKYANGNYELGAFLTTDTGDRRDEVASQPIALNNSGFVQIAYVPGSRFELGPHTGGLTFYGGSSAEEGNVNTFHACPVAYDGTTAGSVAIQAKVTGPEAAPLTSAPPALAFYARGNTPQNGRPLADDEAPFTWEVSSSLNFAVENTAGENEHWILSGSVIDPNGLDVTSKFEQGMSGPLYFDFKAPARTNSSEIAISNSGNPANWESTEVRYYSDGSPANRFRITEMSDMGVGHVSGSTSAIAVGDCSVPGNADTRGSTAFTPLEGLDNVTHVSQLAEEDPRKDPVNDGGGIDCYVAEVQALADRLGNAVNLSRVARIRTKTDFGVDRTAPVISRERPSEALVLNPDGATLFFEVEDPRFDSGEDGSGVNSSILVLAGSSNPRSNAVYWRSDATVADDGSVTIDINRDMTAAFGRERQHTVYAWARDEAGNNSLTSFTFTRDGTKPTFALSAVPSDFGLTEAASVSVTVAGTLTDATEIRRAFLSIHHGDSCVATDTALAPTQVANPVRRLHNGTNRIEFSEVFTVKKAGDIGATDYCFFLSAKDDARSANGGAMANAYEEVVGTFNVTWPGVKPVGPVAMGTISDMSLMTGGTDTRDVSGNFSDANGDALTYTASSDDAAVATVSMAGAVATVTAVGVGDATITVTASDGGTGTAQQSWDVTVTAAPPPTVYELVFTDADEAALTMLEVNEGSGDTGASYMVGLSHNPADTVTVSIEVVEGNRVVYATLSADELTFAPTDDGTAPAGQSVTVTTLVDDFDTDSEMFTLRHTPSGDANFAAKNLAGTVNDDDIKLTVMGLPSRFGENDGDTLALTVVAMTGVPDTAAADRTFSVTLGNGNSSDATWYSDEDATATITSVDMVLEMDDPRTDSMVYIVPVDDAVIEDPADVIRLSAGAVGGGNAAALQTGAVIRVEAVTFPLHDDDPDVTVTVDKPRIAEDAGEQMVTITVTEANGAMQTVSRNYSISLTASATGDDIEYTTDITAAGLSVRLDPGETTGTVSFNLTPTDNVAVTVNHTIGITTEVSSLAEGTGTANGNKTNGVAYTINTAEIVLVNDDT
ncbi:MAG: Ig-like domain-containing protein [Gemmatimonadetes bacterium]|nr:Ig-like domain-containing protein [Candidatus Palauibacter australiensis]